MVENHFFKSLPQCVVHKNNNYQDWFCKRFMAEKPQGGGNLPPPRPTRVKLKKLIIFPLFTKGTIINTNMIHQSKYFIVLIFNYWFLALRLLTTGPASSGHSAPDPNLKDLQLLEPQLMDFQLLDLQLQDHNCFLLDQKT